MKVGVIVRGKNGQEFRGQSVMGHTRGADGHRQPWAGVLSSMYKTQMLKISQGCCRNKPVLYGKHLEEYRTQQGLGKIGNGKVTRSLQYLCAI